MQGHKQISAVIPQLLAHVFSEVLGFLVKVQRYLEAAPPSNLCFLVPVLDAKPSSE